MVCKEIYIFKTRVYCFQSIHLRLLANSSDASLTENGQHICGLCFSLLKMQQLTLIAFM